ncbi:c-type cytochrome [Aneurinibacillus aneurinilyticus]|jgi:cytochrome c551|uniref:Cytochrome c n=2 Tax=Aneurinibacillus aneurinilyticus TaxID=1391 RepID=A0A848CQV7_ANEAE|nr:cytochrome c [Aneurinibacillus aneurinilyticus]ERI04522.1 cytochrome [Aneurinibacillus aneurinilyticus ATCC 12856]MED0670779.1 cytochrome c [Aneurinibacillus aneurinilyticus]MED0706475.1 cytochrome c [Aneurinibacillus aneurinilyticus]MED0721398.1 cytochrome c [Aneurinibacillus aneurinilyticus]MED0731124.1 cytochrome c [Aneurinibacillus aneurinilyticus]
MKKWMMIVSSILLVLVLAVGCGTAKKGEGGAAEKPAPAQKGGQAGGTAGGGGQEAQKVFQANCTSCHGQNMEGGVGPNLTKVGSKYKSADEIKTIILKGRNGMPGGLVSETDAKALADWLITKK